MKTINIFALQIDSHLTTVCLVNNATEAPHRMKKPSQKKSHKPFGKFNTVSIWRAWNRYTELISYTHRPNGTERKTWITFLCITELRQFFRQMHTINVLIGVIEGTSRTEFIQQAAEINTRFVFAFVAACEAVNVSILFRPFASLALTRSPTFCVIKSAQFTSLFW